MTKYIARRLLATIPVLFGVSVVLFAFIHLLPGDPCSTVLGAHSTEGLCQSLHHALGLDLPIYVQYLNYLGGVLHGDFGSSLINGKPVLSEFAARFPATVELTLGALIFAIGVGIPLGQLAARHPHSWVDGGVTVGSLLGISIPVFVVGLVLVFVFSVELGWLPTQGQIDPRLGIPSVTNFVLVDAVLAGRWDAFVDALKHLILPAIAQGSIAMASITRMTRASFIDVSDEDYVRTARAKGLKDRRVNGRHIMRNAWLPVATIVGFQVGGLLSGALLTETIFSWNGVGRWMYQAIQDRDYLVVEGGILIFSLIFLIVNLVVDIVYALINPRIRYA